MIEWLWPWFLLLAPLPWLVQRLAPPVSTRDAALRAPFFEEWRELGGTPRTTRPQSRSLAAIGLWLIWLLLLLAAARPVWIGEAVELPDSGRDLMLAVDISGSMNIADMQLGDALRPRIDAVKDVGSRFIKRRAGDRLGLILFGGNAYVQSPLTFDTLTVNRFLNEAQIGFAGQETAIGDAIGLAVKRLRERPAESRVLILLTDGRDTASSVQPLEAARLAAEMGIRIYTIGMGADSVTLPGLFGSSFGSRRVNPSADLDEAGLKSIAQLTGGSYFRARNPRELAAIYQLLDELEPVEQSTSLYRPRQAL
ncbi:MAG: VWA domain-containing protein, partial [Halioglobus sp.]|nr:VWA domain-containing protein [Halioglobus sp.]